MRIPAATFVNILTTMKDREMRGSSIPERESIAESSFLKKSALIWLLPSNFLILISLLPVPYFVINVTFFIDRREAPSYNNISNHVHNHGSLKFESIERQIQRSQNRNNVKLERLDF